MQLPAVACHTPYRTASSPITHSLSLLLLPFFCFNCHSISFILLLQLPLFSSPSVKLNARARLPLLAIIHKVMNMSNLIGVGTW